MKVQTNSTNLQDNFLDKGFTHIEKDLLYVGSYAVDFENKTFQDMAVNIYDKKSDDEILNILNKFEGVRQ